MGMEEEEESGTLSEDERLPSPPPSPPKLASTALSLYVGAGEQPWSVRRTGEEPKPDNTPEPPSSLAPSLLALHRFPPLRSIPQPRPDLAIVVYRGRGGGGGKEGEPVADIEDCFAAPTPRRAAAAAATQPDAAACTDEDAMSLD